MSRSLHRQGIYSPGWTEAKRKRKERRDKLRAEGKLPKQPRSELGFIIKRRKEGDVAGVPYLEFDTQLAMDRAVGTRRDFIIEQNAITLEKSQRKQAAKPKRKPGAVTTTKKAVKK